MQKIVKNTLLKYIPKSFSTEKTVNQARIFNFNDKNIQNGDIIYLIDREIRINFNFALQFAQEMAQISNKKLKIIYNELDYDFKLKDEFIKNQINIAQKNFLKNNFDFKIIKIPQNELLKYLLKFNTGILIIDFNPISNKNYLKTAPFKIFEVDSHNIMPARFISEKQEYNAASFRHKIYRKIYPFLTEFKTKKNLKTPADIELKYFIQNKLPYYAEFKNNPIKNIQSGLSKYLNLGFISSQEIAIEIIKSNVSEENKEAFLEELIVRKELADNFCLYCKNYKSFSCIPNWAKETLNAHKNDFRNYIYTKKEFEKAETHNKLWNACQKQLLKEGIIHGYLRMYWAKKILEWSISPQKALSIAFYLNDKYALDSPSSNGYTSILWSIAGLHDRAFQNRPISGKIRIMNDNSINLKFKITDYINKY